MIDFGPFIILHMVEIELSSMLLIASCEVISQSLLSWIKPCSAHVPTYLGSY
jgi:hypothetical protein